MKWVKQVTKSGAPMRVLCDNKGKYGISFTLSSRFGFSSWHSECGKGHGIEIPGLIIIFMKRG